MATRTRAKTHREAPELGAMLARMLRAMARRAADGDLEALGELAQLQAVLGQAIVDGARGAHDGAGFSWTEIAAQLGTTRQAARQRFGSGPACDVCGQGTSSTMHRDHCTAGGAA